MDQHDGGNFEWTLAPYFRPNPLRSTSTKLRMASFRLVQRRPDIYCTHGICERRHGFFDLITTDPNVLVAPAITKTEIGFIHSPRTWLNVNVP